MVIALLSASVAGSTKDGAHNMVSLLVLLISEALVCRWSEFTVGE